MNTTVLAEIRRVDQNLADTYLFSDRTLRSVFIFIIAWRAIHYNPNTTLFVPNFRSPIIWTRWLVWFNLKDPKRYWWSFFWGTIESYMFRCATRDWRSTWCRDSRFWVWRRHAWWHPIRRNSRRCGCWVFKRPILGISYFMMSVLNSFLAGNGYILINVRFALIISQLTIHLNSPLLLN